MTEKIKSATLKVGLVTHVAAETQDRKSLIYQLITPLGRTTCMDESLATGYYEHPNVNFLQGDN